MENLERVDEMIFHYLSDNRILYRKGLLRVAVIDGD